MGQYSPKFPQNGRTFVVIAQGGRALDHGQEIHQIQKERIIEHVEQAHHRFWEGVTLDEGSNFGHTRHQTSDHYKKY